MKGDPFQGLCLPAGSPYTRKRILSRNVSLFLLLTTLPPQSLPPACDPLSPLSPSSSGSSGCSSTAASPRGPAASSPLDTVLVTDCGGAGCASFCRRALISLRSMRTRRVRAPLDRIALTRSSFSSSSFSCASGDRWARFSGMRMLSTAREKRGQGRLKDVPSAEQEKSSGWKTRPWSAQASDFQHRQRGPWPHNTTV